MNIGFFFEWIFDTFIVPGGQLLEFLQFGTPEWFLGLPDHILTGLALVPLSCFSLTFIIGIIILRFLHLIKVV